MKTGTEGGKWAWRIQQSSMRNSTCFIFLFRLYRSCQIETWLALPTPVFPKLVWPLRIYYPIFCLTTGTPPNKQRSWGWEGVV